jgi:hypothetical protein
MNNNHDLMFLFITPFFCRLDNPLRPRYSYSNALTMAAVMKGTEEKQPVIMNPPLVITIFRRYRRRR